MFHLNRCHFDLWKCHSFYFPVNAVVRRDAHYLIKPTGEKVVISKRHNIKTKREDWQKVKHMGKEPELRKIRMIEQNERLQADPLVAKMTAQSKLKQLSDRLLTSGFCRETKSYEPPNDVVERIDRISKEIFADQVNVNLNDIGTKFKFLTRCSEEFGHEVPNSDLFRLKTIEDVKKFYQTAVRGINTYDHMLRNTSALPRNLHIIAEPIRFNAQTDTFFGGISAFPGRQNELVGLRIKKKFPAQVDNFVWPDV